MPTLKKRIRIALQIPTARGGQTPLDSATGLPPAFWENEAVDVDVGLFEDSTTEAVVTDLTKLQLVISGEPRHRDPIFTDSATAGDGLDLTMLAADWDAATKQHGTFVIPVSTIKARFGLETSVQLYLAIWGMDDGVWIMLANGPATLHQAPTVGS